MTRTNVALIICSTKENLVEYGLCLPHFGPLVWQYAKVFLRGCCNHNSPSTQSDAATLSLNPLILETIDGRKLVNVVQRVAEMEVHIYFDVEQKVCMSP